MQYRDVYSIFPGSYTWRYLSPGSDPVDKETHPHFIKEDYKTPYKRSSNYLRKLIPYEKPSITYIPKLTDAQKNRLNELYSELPGLKEQIYEDENVNTFPDITEGNLEENARDLVRSMFSASALKAAHPEICLSSKHKSVEDNYVVGTETVGNDKSLDANEGNPCWDTIYFETLQNLYNYDNFLKEEYDYKLPVYVGKTKTWQLVNDSLGKDQVDKLQISIGAPIQEQLDLWDEENSKKFIQMPISNENHAKFRDVPFHHERLDHDYDQIIYERKRNQVWEKMRNSRYWKLDTHDSHEHH